MRLLILALLPLVWVGVCAVLVGLFTPIPMFRPAVRSLLARPSRLLQRILSPLRNVAWVTRNAHGARITALEERNIALEARVAELASCILQSLAISMETQQRLEKGPDEVTAARMAS